MRHASRRQPARVYALRLDPPSVLQAGLAASLAMLITWLTQTF